MRARTSPAEDLSRRNRETLLAASLWVHRSGTECRDVACDLSLESLLRKKSHTYRRRHVDHLSCCRQLATSRINPKHNNIVRFLISREQQRPRRINFEASRRFALRGSVFDRRQRTFHRVNSKDSNAVMSAIRGVEELSRRMHTNLGVVILPAKAFGQSGNILQRMKRAGAKVGRKRRDRRPHLVDHVSKLSIGMQGVMPWPGPGFYLGKRRIVRC